MFPAVYGPLQEDVQHYMRPHFGPHVPVLVRFNFSTSKSGRIGMCNESGYPGDGILCKASIGRLLWRRSRAMFFRTTPPDNSPYSQCKTPQFEPHCSGTMHTYI